MSASILFTRSPHQLPPHSLFPVVGNVVAEGVIDTRHCPLLFPPNTPLLPYQLVLTLQPPWYHKVSDIIVDIYQSQANFWRFVRLQNPRLATAELQSFPAIYILLYIYIKAILIFPFVRSKIWQSLHPFLHFGPHFRECGELLLKKVTWSNTFSFWVFAMNWFL